MVDEKIYTVPLRREFLKAPKYARTKKAVRVLKSYLLKHLKKEVKIGKYLNLELWKNGRKNPPSKIKIRVEEVEDKTVAELINAPRPVIEEKKDDKISIKKPKFLGGKKEETETEKIADKVEEEKKEETKKAIEKVPEKKEEVKESGVVEKEHAHRKQEKVITQKTGQVKSRDV